MEAALRLDPPPRGLTAAIAVKALVLTPPLAALAVPALHRVRGEAAGLRLAVYLAGAVAIPLAWWLLARGRAYPVAADLFLAVPYLYDLAGNSFGLYAAVDNYDNVAHLVGVAALAAGAACLVPRGTLPTWALAPLAGCAGVTLGVGIELVEWTAFAHPVETGFGAYRDTIGDLAMDVLGGALAAPLAAAARRRA